MSAIIKATTVLSGLAVAGVATSYSMKQTGDFSKQALNAAEHGATEVIAAAKPKLPSNFFQFTLGEYKISNARA